MHALRHVHGLLVAGGLLVDLHPVTEEQVEAGGRRIGVIEEPQWVSVDLPNAEAGVLEVIEDGRYRLEAEVELVVLAHYADAESLIAEKADRLPELPSLVRAIRAAIPSLVVREHAVARRLRAC